MDERNWTDEPLRIGEEIRVETVCVVHKPLGYATLVSGNLDAALKDIAPGAREAGLCAEVGDGSIALRIGRDKALLVTNDPIDHKSAWNFNGYAVSPADDCYCLLAVSGDGAEMFLAQGTACNLTNASPSPAILFAGEQALLVRNQSSFHLYVDRAHLTFITSWIRGAQLPDL